MGIRLDNNIYTPTGRTWLDPNDAEDVCEEDREVLSQLLRYRGRD